MSLVNGLAEEGPLELSLPHQSLGDQYIRIISNVVRGLTDISRLNLRDNRLTDVGVRDIVEAICSSAYQGVRVLDISENKLDKSSAQSLCTFLRSASCSLKELLISKANMNEKETTVIMEAMGHNRSVTFLDFSDNAIGGSFEKMQTSSILTGGCGIAQALDCNTTLRRIDLQWNCLGAKSGILLGNALENNHTLEWLNVSYNAIGDRGAQAIGQALLVNCGLVNLDLSYNEISARGVLVIAQGLEKNDRLEILSLNNLSHIGFNGGRMLVRSMNSWTLRRTIGLSGCSMESRKSENNLFDPLYATGRYSLDCSDPYQKAVAYELLRISSIRPGYTIK
ncbi:unnamed protein product [Choristocarpus tenellus]